MSGSGQQAHLGIAKEVTWGSRVGAADHLKFSSETLNLAIEELISSSIRSLRDEPDSFEGLGSIVGNTVHEVHPNGLGYLLRSWFGMVLTTTPTGNVRKHVFTPGKDKEASGTADSGDTTSLVDSGLVSTDDEFNGCWLHIISGTNSGEWRYISDSVASSNTVTVSVAFSSAIDNTSVYEIKNGPKDCVLPPYTLEIGRDLAKSFEYNGAVVNTLAFNYGINAKIINLTAGWISKDVSLIDATVPSPESTDPFRWHQAYLFTTRDYARDVDVNGDTPTTVKTWDTTAAFTASALVGKWIRITSGSAIDEMRQITENTTTTITWSPAMSTATSDGDSYEIWTQNNLLESIAINLNNGLIGIPLLNSTKRIAKIVGDIYRSGSITASMLVEASTDWETYFKGWTTQRWLLLFRGAATTSPWYHELQLYMPKVLFTAYPLGIAGPGQLRVGLTAKIKYDSSLAYLVRAVLYNTLSSYT